MVTCVWCNAAGQTCLTQNVKSKCKNEGLVLVLLPFLQLHLFTGLSQTPRTVSLLHASLFAGRLLGNTDRQITLLDRTMQP
jgi:hypothetical protein